MSAPEFRHDATRPARVGLPEAILCEGKSDAQLADIYARVADAPGATLFTRLDASRLAELPRDMRDALDYDALSRTALVGTAPAARSPARVAVVCAGTSDLPVAREAVRTLASVGEAALEVTDIGVAGLWRLLETEAQFRDLPVKIVVAGMDGALPTVIGGLVPGVVIGVPCSTGYGAADGGRAALAAMLTSCAPGLVVTNIDNGYGAAAAAVRALGLVAR